MTLEELEARLDAVAAERTSRPDQPLGIVTCREALAAARTGNFGVGAALVDPRGTVVEQGRNALFYPRFRSDLHAEMVVMSAFEDRNPAGDSMRGYTLVCSLEPCPMCVARLLIAGVQTVKFLAPDELGGMAGRLQHFPAAWRRFAERLELVQADVSDGLRRFALDVFLLNREACRQRLLSR
jgi:tRNA(Arg) A34 adenosine deaminase TadA